MPAIGRRDRVELQPLGDRDQRRVDEADLFVLADELLDTAPVVMSNLFDRQLPMRNRANEGALGTGADPFVEEVGDLGQNRHGNEQRVVEAFKERTRLAMPGVALVGQGVQDAGVDSSGTQRARRLRARGADGCRGADGRCGAGLSGPRSPNSSSS